MTDDVSEARIIDLEVQVAFLGEQVQGLSASLSREVKESMALHERVAMLERALQTLAARVPNEKKAGGGPDDVGADANNDPVPHSG